MRCLQLISGDLWAGAEVSTYHVIRELASRRGVEVEALVLNPGTLADRIAAAGVEVTLLAEHGTSFPTLAAAAIRHSRRSPPAIVHSHRYKENVLGALVAAGVGVPHVRTAHGLPPEFGARGVMRGLAGLVDGALASFTGSTWILVSRELRGYFEGARRTLHVVPNGLPPEAPVPRREELERAFESGAEAWYVGFVGRLEWVKRPDRFLRVLAALPERIRGREVRGVVVGAGSMSQRLQTELAISGQSSRVRLLGGREQADSLVAALDVLVIPSDHEGHPMVLLEAMRSSIPVVATRVGGLPAVLGSARWTRPVADEAGLAGAVGELLDDDDLRKGYGRELEAAFRARFAIGQTVDRLLAVYRDELRTRR